MRSRILALVLVLCAAVGGGVGLSGCGGSGSPKPSRGVFGPLVGVMFDGPVLTSNVNLDQQLDSAVANGVESLRIAVDWSRAQPAAKFDEVPAGLRSQFQDVDGVPTTFTELDRVVAAATQRGLSVLPVVQDTPAWDAQHPGNGASPPKALAPFGAFLTALVKRYGPHGVFWAEHHEVSPMPIHMWQIWNEPHFVRYWSVQPFAPSYVRLLATAHAALKTADPNAEVVLAGLADFSWEYLAQIYAIPGASRLFDVVAIHPYTAHPAGVITILERARAVMDQNGDAHKPILATEITWNSSLGKAPPQFGVGTTEGGQAQLLNQLMPTLIGNQTKLGLMGFYWYTWMGDESPSSAPDAFDYAGLLKYIRGSITLKPALAVYKAWALRIEGCRSKGKLADFCA
jgi:hypothetical protein